MTTTIEPGTQTDAAGQVPVYGYGQAPEHLRTLTQLRGARLRRAPGQPVEGYLYLRRRQRYVDLFDLAAALPMPAQSLGQAWAWRIRRTCPVCGTVGEEVVRGEKCAGCRRQEHEQRTAKCARTCSGCRRIGGKPYPADTFGRHLCRRCAAKRRAEELQRTREALERAQICPGVGWDATCTERTATRYEVQAWQRKNPRGYWEPRRCPQCTELQAERMEGARAATVLARQEEARREIERREARRREVAELCAWAAAALADPAVVILDTETTGLFDPARIVDIAVTTAAGEVLLDTLVDPGEPIPAEATAIHGITDADVAGAPRFSELVPQLAEVLRGRRVLIYNREFDVDRLRYELGVHHQDDADPAAAAAAWLVLAKFEDVMVPYSDWYGEWSDYWGNYSWQPLGGGHRALGDCLAVIARLTTMARRHRQD